MGLLPEFIGLVQQWPRSFVLVAGSSKVWPKVRNPALYDSRAAEIHLRLQSAGILACRGIGLYESLTRAEDDLWHVADNPQNLRTWTEWLVDVQAFLKLHQDMTTPPLVGWEWTTWLTCGGQPFLESPSLRLADEVLKNQWLLLLRRLQRDLVRQVGAVCNVTSGSPNAVVRGAAVFLDWLLSLRADPADLSPRILNDMREVLRTRSHA